MSYDDMERRTLPQERAGVQLEDGDGLGTLVGYGALFNSRSKPLPGPDGRPFVEIIKPGAFDKVLSRDDRDIISARNHDVDNILGRESNGTLRLATDRRGLRYEVDLPDTSYARDTTNLVERGDIAGSSFTFSVPDDGQEWREEDGQLVREITEFSEVGETGPVTRPAYTATTVDARAMERARRVVEATTSDASLTAKRKREVRERRRELMVDVYPPQDKRLALHEAAHAVVATRLGHDVRSVKLHNSRRAFRGGLPGGIAELSSRYRKPDPAIALAGIASDIKCGMKRRRALRSDRDDVDGALECIERRGWEPKERQIPGHLERAKNLVEEDWTAIQDVAGRLLSIGRIDGRQLRRMLWEHDARAAS